MGMLVIRLITLLQVGVGIQVHLMSSISSDLTMLLIAAEIRQGMLAR
jgi:hypothetical protein